MLYVFLACEYKDPIRFYNISLSVFHCFRPEELSTILDFEDTCSSFIVFECGSLLMYIFCYMNGKGDIGQMGAHVMKRFCQHQPLTATEWSVLFDAVICRLVQSSIYGLYGALLAPENSEYILESQEDSWTIFETLVKTDEKSLITSWKQFVN